MGKLQQSAQRKQRAEAVARRCSVRKVFLKISQNSLENTCARVSFLVKLQASGLFKKWLWHRHFSVNFAKFLETPFLTEYPRWLLLKERRAEIYKYAESYPRPCKKSMMELFCENS